MEQWGMSEACNLRHLRSQPTALCWALVHWHNLMQKRGVSQMLWKGYLQENNKSNSVSLAFSQLGERLMKIVMILTIMVIMINMMSAFTINTNKSLNNSGILGWSVLTLSFLRNSIHLIRTCLKISKNFRNTLYIFTSLSFFQEGCAINEAYVDIEKRTPY